MANRFWVGGTGTWDASTTTQWSATTGGSGGATVPGSGDAVIFDGNSGGGIITVNTNFNITSLTMSAFTGTLDFSANNNSPTMGSFVNNGTSVRTLNMGSGTWTMNGSTGTLFSQSTITNLTLNAGGSTIKYIDTGNNILGFAGSGTLNNVWFSRGASTGIIAIANATTFNELKDTGTAAHTLRFNNSTTYTVSAFTVSGTSGNLISLDSNTTAAYTISKTSGIVSSDFLNIQHCIATGGATWYAGANSTNNQAVATTGSGWIFTAPPAVTLLTNIVSYWKLDGNSNDSVGTNNGTDTSISYSVPNGKINQGAGFNGTTSFITNGSTTGLPSGATSRTLSFWVKTSSATDQELVAYGTNTSGNYFAMGYINQGTGRRLYFAGNAHDVDSGVDIGDGNWHFCAVTYDGTTVRTYVDGTAAGSGAEALNTTGTALFFGAQSSSVFLLNGDLDEIGIWSRVLSAGEISQLYNAGTGLQYPFTGVNSNSSFLSFM